MDEERPTRRDADAHYLFIMSSNNEHLKSHSSIVVATSSINCK